MIEHLEQDHPASIVQSERIFTLSVPIRFNSETVPVHIYPRDVRLLSQANRVFGMFEYYLGCVARMLIPSETDICGDYGADGDGVE